jgi:multicomponent K+:H+ antiporter subunit E
MKTRHPLSMLGILLTWLLLNEPVDTFDLLLAVPVAFMAGAMLRRLQAPSPRMRYKASTLASLAGLTFVDIVQSNFAVCRIALRLGRRGRVPGFVAFPLELRHPAALAILACIVTATPGTSWARYDADRGVLTLHMLDLVDEERWVREFKARYESRLMEIFG